ncbi:MAG: tRNA-dihydrouridine synthase [Candidatus Daviesbacteria bacterium]|nr:tRNA-dihydrouridine synthase [Candidatus Daviesbacteria bacterium]
MKIVNIWQNLKTPFFALAPMEDVTDSAFRQIVAKIGKPDVFFTEFINVDGLFSEGYARVAPRLKYTKIEHPIIAQIWGSELENFTKAAEMIAKLGFDGIDINMGCPQKSVIKQKTCSALIKDPKRAEEIFLAVKKGAGKLPVSIKTRIGFSEIETEKWLGFLLKLKPDALIVHGRTVKEQSKVSAHWEEIGKVVKMRDELSRRECGVKFLSNDNEMGSKTLIVGNGDVKSFQDGKEKAEKYGVDGIMIGRGIFHNPWIFNSKVDIAKITPEQRIEILLDHVKIFKKTWPATSLHSTSDPSFDGTSRAAISAGEYKKDFNIMKKFFKAYIRDFPDALKLRAKLMEAQNAEDIYSTF